MQGLDFSVLWDYLPLLAKGALWTAVISLLSGALALVAGAGFAIIMLYAPRLLRWPVQGVIAIFMGTPLLLQLFLIYFGLVQIGLDIPAFWAGVLGLGLHYSVYICDLLRIGILSIDIGQSEGSRALGFSRSQTLFSVVLPQALRRTIPPIGNSMIALLKDSALVSVISISELVKAAQTGIAETYRPFEFYIAIAAIYYLLNLVLEGAVALLEKRSEATK